MQVSELNVYPVKSTRAISLNTATVDPWGLAGDRRWMVVDENGARISAREDPAMLGVSAQLIPGGLLLDGLEIPEPRGQAIQVFGTGGKELWGVPATPAADEWFTRYLERPARLVWCDDPTRRRLNPEFSHPTDSTGFADGYPLLITTVGSLRQLNDWITVESPERGESPGEPLPMERFRPNIVVTASEPFAEDQWGRVQIGDITYRIAKMCERCVMTTVDYQTFRRGKEPIRTLAKYRRWAGKTWFGVNAIPDSIGEIKIGDPVKALD